jgi:hypothetical protein
MAAQSISRKAQAMTPQQVADADRAETRVCRVCAETKPIDEFDRRRNRGWATWCKTCRNLYFRRRSGLPEVKARYAARQKRVRAEEHNRARERKHSKVYRQRYPEKDAAKRAVRAAIVSGRLVRPGECSACNEPDRKGVEGRTTIHAHHDDYSQPLAVRWLCVSCHTQVHSRDRCLSSQTAGGEAEAKTYRFDRYRAGQKMAEGGRVKATSEAEALVKVTKLFERDADPGEMERTTFKLRGIE